MNRNRHLISALIFGLITLLISACAGVNSGPAVTPLPTVTATLSDDEFKTDLPEKDEVTATPEELSRLEATATIVAEATADSQDGEESEGSGGAERQTGTGMLALATFTPAPNIYGPGEARAMALATDTVMVPEIEEPLTFDVDPVPLVFDEFYSGFSIRTGLQASDKLKSLDGQRVVIEGYVAPPLKPRLDFFVLTKIQLAFCPFCSTDVEWPDDIALVYLPEQQIISSEFPVRVTGTLEIGSNIDAETGMVSLVRVYSENMETLD